MRKGSEIFAERNPSMASEQNRPNDPAPAPAPSSFRTVGGVALVCVVFAVACVWVMNQEPRNGHAKDLDGDLPPANTGGGGAQDFKKWPKPDFALVVTGQMHGYYNFCGCSVPQYGGLPRRWNFVDSLRKMGWDVAGVDVGEIMAKQGIKEQNLLKHKYTMDILKLMNYRAVGIGREELMGPLSDVLAQHSINDPLPRPVSLTLAETGPNGLYHKMNARPHEIFDANKIKVGVMGVIGADLVDLFPKEKAIDNAKGIKASLDDFGKNKVELGIILFNEYPDPKAVAGGGQAVADALTAKNEVLAKHCAKLRAADPKLPALHLLIGTTEETDPSGVLRPINGTPTNVINMGHKGRYVGLVGVYRKAKGDGFDFRFQIVSMDPSYETPVGKEADNPALQGLEKYTLQVKNDKMIDKAPRSQHPVQVFLANQKRKSEYVGSDSCKGCHENAWDVWQKTGHSHAFDALTVKAKNPGNRQFDPECVVCHTVGFEYETGYGDPKAGVALKDLEHVGCENCHGPGSAHVAKPRDEKLYKEINPYRAGPTERDPKSSPAQREALRKNRMQMLDSYCQKCHDLDNDVHWAQVPFEKKWEKIAHPMRKAGAAPGAKVGRLDPAASDGSGLADIIRKE